MSDFLVVNTRVVISDEYAHQHHYLQPPPTRKSDISVSLSLLFLELLYKSDVCEWCILEVFWFCIFVWPWPFLFVVKTYPTIKTHITIFYWSQSIVMDWCHLHKNSLFIYYSYLVILLISALFSQGRLASKTYFSNRRYKICGQDFPAGTLLPWGLQSPFWWWVNLQSVWVDDMQLLCDHSSIHHVRVFFSNTLTLVSNTTYVLRVGFVT